MGCLALRLDVGERERVRLDGGGADLGGGLGVGVVVGLCVCLGFCWV